MTAPLPPDPADVLTRLEELHKAATPGEWFTSDQDVCSVVGRSRSVVGQEVGWADAAAIVAEHNATGPLIEIVREFWNEHDGRTCHDRSGPSFHGDELCPTRQMIADLLGGAR